ncbi:MAG: Fur family transcriptional regulator [Desulfovibrionaceae bacterium]
MMSDRRERLARLDRLMGRLKEHGLRMTPQRAAILRALVMDPNHPSVETLHRRLVADYPNMSLATVYKTMNLLKELGEVRELEFSSRDNRFDGFIPQPHPHLICTRCGRIIDPDVPELKDLIENLVHATGFDVQSHRLDFYGLCPSCLKKD